MSPRHLSGAVNSPLPVQPPLRGDLSLRTSVLWSSQELPRPSQLKPAEQGRGGGRRGHRSCKGDSEVGHPACAAVPCENWTRYPGQPARSVLPPGLGRMPGAASGGSPLLQATIFPRDPRPAPPSARPVSGFGKARQLLCCHGAPKLSLGLADQEEAVLGGPLGSSPPRGTVDKAWALCGPAQERGPSGQWPGDARCGQAPLPPRGEQLRAWWPGLGRAALPLPRARLPRGPPQTSGLPEKPFCPPGAPSWKRTTPTFTLQTLPARRARRARACAQARDACAHAWTSRTAPQHTWARAHTSCTHLCKCTRAHTCTSRQQACPCLCPRVL